MQAQNSKIKDVIIKAAIELFKEKSYNKVSVNEICKRAYVARSSFYYVFSSKMDIIEYILHDIKEQLVPNIEGLFSAKNDFERMWMVCDRYLLVVLHFGPELSISLRQLELEGETDMLIPVRSMTEKYEKLTRRAQRAGIVLNTSSPKALAQLAPELAYHIIYEWSRTKGAFPLRKTVRQAEETLFNVAPEYRMSEEELDSL